MGPYCMCNYNIESKLLSPKALDKAKDAGRKERVLCKQREQAQATEQINLDLTYCVSAHSAQKAHSQAIYRVSWGRPGTFIT